MFLSLDHSGKLALFQENLKVKVIVCLYYLDETDCLKEIKDTNKCNIYIIYIFFTLGALF